jgi:uncharacterized protein (TIGR02145 family)
MGENLNVNKFRNGNIIQQAQTAEQWEKAGFAKQPAWCYYEMDSKNGKIYGKLYNRFALYDPRGLAPKGWRLPSDKDWELLTAELGGAEVAGAKLKSATAWIEDKKLDDPYGFNALPGGWRDVGFGGLEDSCTWWSKNSETLEDDTRYYNLSKGIDHLMNYSTSWIMGYFVRCVKE